VLSVKGGSGHSGGFANYGGERGVWYQSVKGGDKHYPVMKTVNGKQIPYHHTIWIFPPTMHGDWNSIPTIRPERWAELQMGFSAKGSL
jgi:hypothetical protein